MYYKKIVLIDLILSDIKFTFKTLSHYSGSIKPVFLTSFRC